MNLQRVLINHSARSLPYFRCWIIPSSNSDDWTGGSEPTLFPSRFRTEYFAPGRHLLHQTLFRRRRAVCETPVPASLRGGE